MDITAIYIAVVFFDDSFNAPCSDSVKRGAFCRFELAVFVFGLDVAGVCQADDQKVFVADVGGKVYAPLI